MFFSTEEKIHEKVRNLGLNEKVMFLGVREDIPELMQAMDVFVFPSLFEGLPVTLIEAQAAGLPCVVSGTITKEIDIAENIAFITLEKSTKEWAGKILKDRYLRKNELDTIRENKFDIYENVIWLERFYIKRGV